MTKSTQNGAASNYKYSRTADSDVQDVPLDKTKRAPCQRCALGGCVVGLILVISAIIVAFVIKPLVNRKIVDEMVLFEGGKAFEGWKNPPVNPVMKVYFFNLTNKEAFLDGREKPRLEKCGPYVYVEHIQKVNVSFDDLGELVTFSDRKHYFFSQALSNGSESDSLTLPNLPMFGAFRNLSKNELSGFELHMNRFNWGIDKTPFLSLTVKEFLWGYPSLIMSLKSQQECLDKNPIDILAKDDEEEDEDWDWDRDWDDESDEDEPINKTEDKCSISEENPAFFAFYTGTNGTVLNTRTIRTGKSHISVKGEMVSFQNKVTLGTWQTDSSCNLILGRDPGTMSLGLDKHTTLELYFANMCRGMKFHYRKTVEHAGIETLRFVPAEDTFHNPQDNPDNSCYCSQSPCLPSGVFDIGEGCKPGSPVYMSWPHFLHGDPMLRSRVEGLASPRRDKDEFYLDIEPQWGATLSAHAAFQFNILVDPDSYEGFSKIKKRVMLPFLMLEEGVAGPNESVSTKMEMLLTIGDKVKNLMFLVLVTIGFLCMLPEIVIWSRSCCCPKK